MTKEVAQKTKPLLWKRIVQRVKKGIKYGEKNTWNARKAQYAVKLYKDVGGEYKGKKEKSNALAKWTKQDWQYSSTKSKGKGRYLPKTVWDKLSKKEKRATNQKKRNATKQGKQKATYSTKITKLVNKA